MKNTLLDAQRQAANRAIKKSAGFVRFTLRVDARTSAPLRRLAKSKEPTQARVVEAALVLFDNKQLLKGVQALAAKSTAKVMHGAPASVGSTRIGKNDD